MDSLMNVMKTQIIRSINFAVNDIVFPEIQNIVGNLPLGENNFWTGTSTSHQGLGIMPDGSNLIFLKKDSSYAFDIRGDADSTPCYKYHRGQSFNQ